MGKLTNTGKYKILEYSFRGGTIPTNYYVALVSDTPTVDTVYLGELTEITAGNGYTAGGYSLTPGSSDFDVLNKNDSDDYSYVQIRDISWSADGGLVPKNGDGILYAVLTDDASPSSDRIVLAYYQLGSEGVYVRDGNSLTVQNREIRLSES